MLRSSVLGACGFILLTTCQLYASQTPAKKSMPVSPGSSQKTVDHLVWWFEQLSRKDKEQFRRDVQRKRAQHAPGTENANDVDHFEWQFSQLSPQDRKAFLLHIAQERDMPDALAAPQKEQNSQSKKRTFSNDALLAASMTFATAIMLDDEFKDDGASASSEDTGGSVAVNVETPLPGGGQASGNLSYDW